MTMIKPSFVIAATVAALAISVWTGRKRRHKRDSPGDAKQGEQIRLLAKELRKRKTVLEKRLLELCEAREEYRLIIRLRRRLSEKCSEVESLDSEVRKLWAERDALKEELRKSADGAEELRSVRGVIMGLQERIDSRNKELKAVEERVEAVWRNNVRCDEGLGVGDKEKDATSDLKIDVLEFQRTNKELKLETRELELKLDAAWARIAELLNGIESEHEMIAEFKKEAALLRRGNEDLQKRVDQLQKQRFDTVEELVYMRWLNICLRFEAEESYETSQRTSTDPPHCNYRREWSAEYVDKTRRILTAVSRGPDSSRTSMENHELGTSSSESTTSSSDKNEKRYPLIHRMKHWGRGKKNRNGNPRLMSDENAMEGGRRIRRFSMSMVPDPRATTESPDAKKGLSRLRRVSFNDALRASEPLLGNNATSPGTTEVAKGPDSRTQGTTNPKHQNINARSDVGGSISRADNKQNREQEEDARAAAEVGTVDVVVTVTGICEMCLAVVFLVLVLILTLYYRIV
ncbi:hypothetical protein MLD38_030100 [Melastoma candidum]|uniref:Uncharacterized protein n=1 Tax=Melastoma candidum TaxID=119954 RepID=A0ACB9ML87_9MYRT|nr:hypothetical protein MLD38_030100 [Melastoma candidum]